MMSHAATAMLLLAAATANASAPTPRGDWIVKDKSARINIHDCGADLCGNVSWTTDGAGIGDAVLIDMAPDGSRWTGTVIDVRNGRHYYAHIKLTSDNLLRLDGCVLGGLICSGETWTRFVPPAPAPATSPRRGTKRT